MADNLIITIGRVYGGGGLTIGKKLAERLGVKCYDKELITLAAKESGLCTEVFEHNDEKPTSSFFYSLVMDTHGIGQPMNNYVNVPLNQKVFQGVLRHRRQVRGLCAFVQQQCLQRFHNS